MQYIILSILCSSWIVLGLREVGRRNTPLLPAVVFNYLTCAVTGWLMRPDLLTEIANSDKSWTFLAILEGAMFISLFFLIGKSTVWLGSAYTAIVVRASVVVPLLASVWVYGESISLAKIIGLLLALGAVGVLHLRIFTEKKSTNAHLSIGQQAAVGAILFFGAGWADTNFKIYEHEFSGQIGVEAFSFALFVVAGGLGLAVLLFQLLQRKTTLTFSGWVAGAAIGIPNYFSVYFLMMALKEISGSVFYPINNIGVMLAVSLAGFLFYREPANRETLVGLGLAAAAIVVLALG